LFVKLFQVVLRFYRGAYSKEKAAATLPWPRLNPWDGVKFRGSSQCIDVPVMEIFRIRKSAVNSSRKPETTAMWSPAQVDFADQMFSIHPLKPLIV
jgi:hypothetical protein